MMPKKGLNLNKEYYFKLKRSDFLFIGVLALVFGAYTEFFYRQIIRYNGYYQSDTSYYVNKAIEGTGTRAISVIFNKLYCISESVFEMAIFLGLVIVLIIIANYLISTWIVKNEGICTTTRCERQLVAIIALFTGPIYMVVLHEYYYAHSWSKFAWHSPTQQLMTLAALITVYIFFLIFDNYMNGINVFLWFGLMASSFISAWAKPSFMLAFIPTIIIIFLIELFTKDKYSCLKKLKKLFVFGFSMIPSGIYILYLNNRLYGEKATNEVVLKANAVLSNDDLLIIIICSLAFPLVVLAFNLTRYKTISFKVAVYTFIFGLLESLAFAEQGDRATAGNFAWGRIFGTYILFLYAINIALVNFKDKEFLSKKKAVRIIYFLCLAVLLILHILSHLYYLYRIFKGENYLI